MLTGTLRLPVMRSIISLLMYKEESKKSEIHYPMAHRMLEKCDAVLRLEGASKRADEDVRKALERGLKMYYRWKMCRMGINWRRNAFSSFFSKNAKKFLMEYENSYLCHPKNDTPSAENVQGIRIGRSVT